MDYLHVQVGNPWYNYYLHESLSLASSDSATLTKPFCGGEFSCPLDYCLVIKRKTAIEEISFTFNTCRAEYVDVRTLPF